MNFTDISNFKHNLDDRQIYVDDEENTLSPLIVIVGETASGKSALAMELAKRFNGEIISADSWTVYKGFDIGTAKPNEAERREIPHHLLDIADPAKGFSAAEFKRQATAVIDDILKRGKLSILVGGTGLYIDSVIYDYGFLPAGPVEERRRLDGLSNDELLSLATSRAIDTTGIDIGNKRRLVRLIESNGIRPYKSSLRPDTLIIGLLMNKDELEQRITVRTDNMLTAGLEQEVKSLADMYGWLVEPMKGIGYREWQTYFAGDQSLEQTRRRIISGSMQLAKKQRTWFRSSRYDQPPVNGSHFLAKTGPGALDVPMGTSPAPKPVSSQKLSTPNKTNDRSATTERNKSIHWLQNSRQAAAVVQKFLSK